MDEPPRTMGAQASFLAARLGVWQRLDAARLAAETTDEVNFALRAREHVELLARTLANLLFIHEPRDGSPYCPTCSTPRDRRAWPCPTWELASRELMAGPH